MPSPIALPMTCRHHLGAALPTHLLGLIAGAMFIFFGLWTLRGDSLSDEEASLAEKATAPAFFVVTSAFVLAELGDKTMLATVTLASDNNWLGVWIGSTLGMVAADALAIVVGAVLGKRLPERIIQIGAAALFLLFGAYMLWAVSRFVYDSWQFKEVAQGQIVIPIWIPQLSLVLGAAIFLTAVLDELFAVLKKQKPAYQLAEEARRAAGDYSETV